MAGTNYKCSSHQSSPLYEVAAVSISIVLSLAVIGLLAVALHCCLRWLKEAQEDDASDCRRASTNGDDRVVPQHQQPARRRWSWRWSGRRSRSCARTGGQTGGRRRRARCAWRKCPTATTSGCCRYACTTSTLPASRTGCWRTIPAHSAVARFIPLPLLAD